MEVNGLAGREMMWEEALTVLETSSLQLAPIHSPNMFAQSRKSHALTLWFHTYSRATNHGLLGK